MLTKEERINRILARGEVHGHCHVIVGKEVKVTRNDRDEIIIEVGNEDAVLCHILEKPWIDEGEQIWTKEHMDIPIKKGLYEYIPQNEYNPFFRINNRILD